jgi:hypothetical protein
LFRGCESGDTEGQFAVPGACTTLAEWNFAHAPHEHRSLLVEIDAEREKGLALPAVLVLFFLRMTLQAELNQPVHQFGIINAGGGPHFGIHAD